MYLPCNKMCTYGALGFYSFINELTITLYHTLENFAGANLAKGIQFANFFLTNIYKYSEMTENRSANLPSPNAIISNESPKFFPS